MDNAAPVMETLSVGELISNRDAVSPQMRVEAVVDQFFNGRKLEALALVEEGRVLGLALRGKVFATLFSRRFGFELYARSPIIEIAENAPLIVRVTEALDIILEKAMQRPAADIYDTPFRTTEMIQTWRPDLVLLDVNMPGLAGDRLCALIRGNQRIQTKIFFHSSNDETSLRQAVDQYGADDYVCKGDISGLRRKVAQVLR